MMLYDLYGFRSISMFQLTTNQICDKENDFGILLTPNRGEDVNEITLIGLREKKKKKTLASLPTVK